jgi:uncharacterized protein YdhG (YjbR/CyaY superfamily)
MAMGPVCKDIDDYIRRCPKEVQALLREMRQAVHSAAPQAQETISYQMPAFRLNGILVYFAASRHHIGFYPTPSAITAFKPELAPYKSSRGAVQFPLEKPLPLGLVRKMVRYRVKEDRARAAGRSAKA